MTGRGMYDRAIEICSTALRLNPFSAARYEDRIFVYLQKGDYDAALSDARHMIDLWPSSSRAYRLCGDVHRARRDFAQAINNYQKALELDPRETGQQRELSELLLQMDNEKQ